MVMMSFLPVEERNLPSYDLIAFHRKRSKRRPGASSSARRKKRDHLDGEGGGKEEI